MNHGRYTTYTNHKCRCELCRTAWTAYNVALHRRMKARLAADPSAAPHGKYTTYRNWGCRCRPCTDAHAATSRWQRRRPEEAA